MLMTQLGTLIIIVDIIVGMTRSIERRNDNCIRNKWYLSTVKITLRKKESQ